MKRALVISGGGSKGAFAVGVIKNLVQLYNLQFDLVVGTSTGALIAPLAVLGEIQKLEELYTTTTSKQIIKKYNLGERLNENSIFTVEPLWEKINQTYSDSFFQTLSASNKEIYINTVCLQDEELYVFTNASDPQPSTHFRIKKMMNAEHFRRSILASACQPVFMTPVKVNLAAPGDANPDYQFVDGGIREYAGVEMALHAGADEIFVVILSARNTPIYNNQLDTLFPVLEKTISIFTTDVGKNDLVIPFQYNEGLKYIEAVKNKMKRAGVPTDTINDYFTIQGRTSPFENKKPVKIHIIQPEDPLGGGPGGLDFVPDEMKQMLAKGQSALADYVALLNPGDVDWA